MDVALTEPDAEHVLTLRDLIQRHMDLTGESRRALGARSGVAHQTLGYWWDGTIKTFPEPDTIKAFADATRTPLPLVLLAAASTIGLPVTNTPGLAAMLPPGTDNLTSKDVDAILGIIRALIDARQQGSPPPEPDLAEVQGIRLDETSPNLRVVESTNGTEGT
jgi:hypothetical protein